MTPQQQQVLAQLISAATGRRIRPVYQSQQRMLASDLAGSIDLSGADLSGLVGNGSNGNESSGNSELKQMIRQNQKSIQKLMERMDRNFQGGGGTLELPNYERGIGGGIHHSQPGTGGVNQSDTFTVPSGGGVSGGQIEILEFSGTELRRLQNNVLCRFEAVAGPDTADQAENITVDMLWNDEDVPGLQDIPLSYLIPTLEGQRQYWEFGKYVPTNIVPGFRVTFNEGFAPSNNEPLFFRAWSAENCG